MRTRNKSYVAILILMAWKFQSFGGYLFFVRIFASLCTQYPNWRGLGFFLERILEEFTISAEFWWC